MLISSLTPEMPQSPDARLSWAFVVRGFISMIYKVKMQQKIQRDWNSMTLTFALTFFARRRWHRRGRRRRGYSNSSSALKCRRAKKQSKTLEYIECIGCFVSHARIFQLYMPRHIDEQVDWRRSWTCGRAPNAIDISQGSLTCPSKYRQSQPFYGYSKKLPHFSLLLWCA